MPKNEKITTSKSEPESNLKQKIITKGLLAGAVIVIIVVIALIMYFIQRNGEDVDSPVTQNKQQEEKSAVNTNNADAVNPENTINDQTIIDAAKADGEALNRLANVTLDGYYKDEEAWCEAANEKADTRQHLYYVYADEVKRLNAKYAEYGIVFDADVAIANTFKDKCEEYGFILE